jgi:hypothetical protein
LIALSFFFLFFFLRLWALTLRFSFSSPLQFYPCTEYQEYGSSSKSSRDHFFGVNTGLCDAPGSPADHPTKIGFRMITDPSTRPMDYTNLGATQPVFTVESPACGGTCGPTRVRWLARPVSQGDFEKNAVSEWIFFFVFCLFVFCMENCVFFFVFFFLFFSYTHNSATD